MSRLRRYSYQGYLYFITSVIHYRNPILTQHADLFLAAIDITKTRVNFKQIAWVIMPDHFHFLVDPADSNLSDIMRRVKQSFSIARKLSVIIYAMLKNGEPFRVE